MGFGYGEKAPGSDLNNCTESPWLPKGNDRGCAVEATALSVSGRSLAVPPAALALLGWRHSLSLRREPLQPRDLWPNVSLLLPVHDA